MCLSLLSVCSVAVCLSSPHADPLWSETNWHKPAAFRNVGPRSMYVQEPQNPGPVSPFTRQRDQFGGERHIRVGIAYLPFVSMRQSSRPGAPKEGSVCTDLPASCSIVDGFRISSANYEDSKCKGNVVPRTTIRPSIALI